jgi:hypothetical protein
VVVVMVMVVVVVVGLGMLPSTGYQALCLMMFDTHSSKSDI